MTVPIGKYQVAFHDNKQAPEMANSGNALACTCHSKRMGLTGRSLWRRPAILFNVTPAIHSRLIIIRLVEENIGREYGTSAKHYRANIIFFIIL